VNPTRFGARGNIGEGRRLCVRIIAFRFEIDRKRQSATMIPIYEQGSGKGIGHNLPTFLARFQQICQEHLEAGRAKAFAFVFYDFTDQKLRAVLKDQGVFARLDRLSGKDLSVFYLHTGRKEAVKQFNQVLLTALGIQEEAQLPCVVFCRLRNNQFEDVTVAQLQHADLIHAFDELYGLIGHYIAHQDEQKGGLRYVKWLKSGVRFVAEEAFKTALEKLMGGML
jgi:hypothetical protein